MGLNAVESRVVMTRRSAECGIYAQHFKYMTSSEYLLSGNTTGMTRGFVAQRDWIEVIKRLVLGSEQFSADYFIYKRVFFISQKNSNPNCAILRKYVTMVFLLEVF